VKLAKLTGYLLVINIENKPILTEDQEKLGKDNVGLPVEQTELTKDNVDVSKATWKGIPRAMWAC
jgi:hypothetical protein